MSTTSTRKRGASTEPKRDIYQEVTDAMVAALEAGTVPWHKPWTEAGGMPRNLQSNRPYRGVNPFLLAMRGFSDPRWTTFKAAKTMGGKVRKGEKGALVTFWKRIVVEDETTATGKRTVMMLRHYVVFNVAQVEWPEGVLPALPEEDAPLPFAAHDEAERIAAGYVAQDRGPALVHGSSGAFYRPADHLVSMPDRERFETPEAYYSTLFHEFTHSTGHPSILAREFGKRFGSDKYAREELIAEMGAAFLAAEAGIDGTFDQSAAYIANWLAALKDDKRLVVTAAGRAQRAADAICGREWTPDTDQTAEPETARA